MILKERLSRKRVESIFVAVRPWGKACEFVAKMQNAANPSFCRALIEFSAQLDTALSQISVKLINHEIDEPSFPSKTSFRKHNLSPRQDKGSLNLYLTVLQVNLQPKGRGKNILKINCKKRGERHVLVLPPSRTGGIVFYRRNIGELKPAYRGIGSNCQRKQALLLRSNFKVGWTRLRAAYSWKKGKKLSSI